MLEQNMQDMAIARLEKRVQLQTRLIDGLQRMNACYRVGTQRGSSTALDKIESARAGLAKLDLNSYSMGDEWQDENDRLRVENEQLRERLRQAETRLGNIADIVSMPPAPDWTK